MRVNKLRLANVRVFKQAEFEFYDGINLLVGVNGAGKSTILDMLRKMFSQKMPLFTSASSREVDDFSIEDDIRISQPALTAELFFELERDFGNQLTILEDKTLALRYLVHLQREKYTADPLAQVGQIYESGMDLIERNNLYLSTGNIITKFERNNYIPGLVVYFSPHRSVIESDSRAASSKKETAYSGALRDRGLNIREFALWLFAQEELSKEDASRLQLIHTLNQTIGIFLEGYSKVEAIREPRPTLLIDKAGQTLDIRQLSDGERSMVALVLDLAKRLTLANPHLADPIHDGKAVVLIDELDLHLHPSWQLTICERLENTFPNCQFIATTHSPLIIGNVKPEKITIIESGKAIPVDQSLGMDANWVLRHIMGEYPRRADTRKQLETIETLIENEQYDEANEAIAKLRHELGEFPDLVQLQTEIDLIDYLADEFDEGDDE